MLWIYDLPTWLLGLLIVGGFTLLSLGGLYATRRLIRRVVGSSTGVASEGVDVFINSAVLIYGLIAGLLAVAVWEQYARVDDQVSSEANALATIYRDASAYPEPWRGKLTAEIRTYVRYLIDVAWPLQRKGIVPDSGVRFVNAIEYTLYAYEPKSEGQKILATSAVDEFNRYLEFRRARLYLINSGLPGPLWAVIMIGAVITIVLTYFLALERWSAHIIMTTFTAIIISLLIFMIAVMDHPFRGEVSVGPDAFELVYQQLMQPSTP